MEVAFGIVPFQNPNWQHFDYVKNIFYIYYRSYWQVNFIY